MLGPVHSRVCRQAVNGDTRLGQDIEGRAVDATLWALPFETLPFQSGAEVKIVWRMTGSGPPQFTVVGPAGEDPHALRWDLMPTSAATGTGPASSGAPAFVSPN